MSKDKVEMKITMSPYRFEMTKKQFKVNNLQELYKALWKHFKLREGDKLKITIK